MLAYRAPSRLHTLIFAAVVCLLSGIPSPAAAQTVVVHDWEDGTLEGWTPRGGVTLTNVTGVSAGGERSLLTTGRTANWNGPSLNVLPLLSPGTVYRIRAAVRLAAGEPATDAIMTIQRTPTSGGDQFDRIAAAGATGDGWVTLEGTYSVAGGVSGLVLYIESASPTASYYVDDFSISVVHAVGCADPPDTSGIRTGFESGTTEGWGPRIGRESVTVTSADAHSGTYSLLTTGRQAFFDGPAIDAGGKLCNGSRYQVSVWVRMAPGEPDTQIRVSLQRTFGGVTSFHTVVGNTLVTAGAWVRLRATYDFAFNYDALSLYVESSEGTASFYIDDFEVAFVPPPVAERDIPSVHETLAEYFPVGAAIWQGHLTGEQAFLLGRHFNLVVSENDMKWGSLQPAEGTFSFAAADAQVAFAKARGMAVRGHTLVWHNQTPAWVFQHPDGTPLTSSPADKALLLQRLEDHIRTVVSHFGADVYAWDVVNEVIDPAQPDGFRRSPWFTITGTEYIDRAFQVARAVAPHAKLYVNDYSTTDEPKRTFLLNLVAGLKSRGIPVDGMGHQMHNNVEYPSATAIIETVNRFAALGVEQEVTELDVSIYSGSFPAPIDAYEDIPADRFVRQAFKYRDFFGSFRYLADKIASVTFWGTADDHTWLTQPGRVNAPLLFDTSLLHKPAYTAIVDPSAHPGAGSTASFSGAFVVRPADARGARRTAAATISLSNDGPSGHLRLNYNDPTTRVQLTGDVVITYDRSSSAAGERVDFTVIAENAGAAGHIVTGYLLDGGPAGSGRDRVSITVRTALGALVYSVEGAVSEGDVIVNP